MDQFKIDSHKLIYHLPRVNDWLKGNEVYPIYLEIAPSGSCNHRCTYCGLDFLGYQPALLKTGLLKKRLSEMSRLGVKSVMYAGEGEPLLHPDIAEIISWTKKCGIDAALTTNGVLLNESLLKQVLPHLTWIKVSINAGKKETYARIHRTRPEDFSRVIGNLEAAVRLKKAKGYRCTLGMQILLLPENAAEVLMLAKKAKGLGVDYLVVKPYSQHPLSRTTKYKDIRYNDYFYLAQALAPLNSQSFNVIFRMQTMKKWDAACRNYRHCNALSFWSYIDAKGNLWGCSAYLGNKKFLYGNIYENSFGALWKGKARLAAKKMAQERLNTDLCRVNCRMDEINSYLWELKHPGAHVNFI